MSKTTGSRSQTNPYQLEELFVKFHRTPAGIAWRWRTELAITALLAAALWRLSILITITWAGVIMAAALASEIKSREFFEAALGSIQDAGVRALFQELRGDEVEHQALVQAEIAKLPPDSGLSDEDFVDEPAAQ